MKRMCEKCHMVVKGWAEECPKCGGGLKPAPIMVRKAGGDPVKDRPRWTK
jgi:hypothetical protein